MQEADTLQRFMFEHSNVRGNIVHLGAGYQAVRNRYDYPDAVAQELGQALAAGALLGTTIKFSGSLIIQIQSSGPVNLMVAQFSHDRHIRGLARWQGDVASGSLKEIYGDGRMVITIDADRHEERYQGIVGLEGEHLSHAIENYFRQSEQLETRLWLVADQEKAIGMMLQKLPGEKSEDADMWNRVEALGATLTNPELLQLSTREILHRLFHEEDIRLFDPEPVTFRCSCSREKITTMLRSLGVDEARDIIKEQGNIEVGCEFCNQQYHFDSVDVEEMFSENPTGPSSDSIH